MTTRIVTVSELKIKLGTLMAELEEQGVPLYVTQHGKPRAVLASYDEYEALLKKVEDLEDLLDCKVDVVTESSLSPYIREDILKEAVNL